MKIFTIFLTAVGLAMDAFAVSVSNGVCIKELKPKHGLTFGLYFGFFQFLMPIIGYLLGTTFESYITEYDHWVAFALLGFVGGKMIYESFKDEKLECPPEEKILAHKNMLTLAIATSIDALAIGISIAVTKDDIWSSAITIGIVTFCLSAVGVSIGKKIGETFSEKAERIGGIVLVLIGIKILLEHTLLAA